jgi:chemotaxis methyl-accepting protein methylase
MTEPDTALAPILDFLAKKRGFDFAGCHQEMLARRIGKRLAATACNDFGEYLVCLKRDAEELDRLIDAVTINVSRFFRDSLTFELIADRILPAMVREKAGVGDSSLRIWSAGCAGGEEPYSVAILLHELQEKEGRKLDLHLFATDIDAGALKVAREALYTLSDVEHMKHRLLLKYFAPEGGSFRLIPEIRAKVHFSLFDMLDRRRSVPHESVFGGFDMAFCRNLLIYFNPEYQVRIFKKIHHALAGNGYLILGEAETPPPTLRHHFKRVFEFSPIYRKR